MDSKTKGIVATVAAVLLCGCPGLFMCIFGAVSAAGVMPYNTDVNGVTSSGMVSPTIGYVLVCLSLIFIAIPIVVGFVMLRKKPETPGSDMPIPPAA
jgi:purine-cytosine permease-like protein